MLFVVLAACTSPKPADDADFDPGEGASIDTGDTTADTGETPVDTAETDDAARIPEFISRVPAGMLSELGLKRHYKLPEPVKVLRPELVQKGKRAEARG